MHSVSNNRKSEKRRKVNGGRYYCNYSYKNEEVNILDCIRSIATTVKRIVVVDSFSTDNTVEYAKSVELRYISIHLRHMQDNINMQ